MNTATSAAAKDRPRDLFVTKATLHRRKAAPNLQAEAAAFRGLSKSLADDPCVAVRNLLESAQGLCHAGSAGVSLLREDDTGQPIVRWAAISGALAAHEGTDTPRDASPCGLCMDIGTTIRVWRPERTFTSLRSTRPAIVEDLIVPLHDNAGKTLGTLWIAHHDRRSHFCSDDARIAEQLAAQLVLALSLSEQASERRGNRQALAFKDSLIQEVNHRTKNTLQAAASLLFLHARATSSTQVRSALLDSRARLQLLAKVHELLYTKIGSAQTVLMPELLQILAEGLRQSFARMSAQVQLELTCDSLSLPVDQAIPLALLVNEVVTNAYKHAFPNDSCGAITVSLRRPSEHALILRIADTGIGWHATGGGAGIGLRLIRNFAAQLQGTLTLATPADQAGTAITLTIDPLAPA